VAGKGLVVDKVDAEVPFAVQAKIVFAASLFLAGPESVTVDLFDLGVAAFQWGKHSDLTWKICLIRYSIILGLDVQNYFLLLHFEKDLLAVS
jgi:hypothetical protein